MVQRVSDAQRRPKGPQASWCSVNRVLVKRYGKAVATVMDEGVTSELVQCEQSPGQEVWKGSGNSDG
jgi:hypothetical protein